MKYQLGMRGHDLGSNLDEMCENAKKYGIKNLQFALAKTVNDVDFDEVGFDEKLAREIKGKLDEYGLHVSVLGCYINPIERDEEKLEIQLVRFENFIKYAKVFGANMIATETGICDSLEESHSEEVYEYCLKSICRLVKTAEKEDVFLAIEPVYVGTIYSPERMKRLMDDVASPNLVSLLDVTNLMSYEVRDTQKDIIHSAFNLYGDRIKGIHLKDLTFNEEKEKCFAPAGTGELMIEFLFEEIEALDHTPEIILDEMPLSYYSESVEKVKKILGKTRL